MAPKILGCCSDADQLPSCCVNVVSSRLSLLRIEARRTRQTRRPASDLRSLLTPRRIGRAYSRPRSHAPLAVAKSFDEPAADSKHLGRPSLFNLPALPAVLLLLGNAVLTKDALLLASFFGLQAALPIPKLRKLGLSAYNALAASVTLVFLTWAAIIKLLPAQQLQVMNVQSYLTIPLPKLLVHHSTKLATSTGFSRTACNKLLTSSTALPAVLLLSFLTLNILVLQFAKRKAKPILSQSNVQPSAAAASLMAPEDLNTDATTILSADVIPEISHKQRASDDDWAKEDAKDQESTGSESGSSGGSSRSKIAKTSKTIAGVQSLEDIHRDQLALQELRHALIPTETLGIVPIHDTPTLDHESASKLLYEELLGRVRVLEEKQAAKGMAAKVRDEQLKVAAAALRMEMGELKENLKAEGSDYKAKHKEHTAALKELHLMVDSLNQQGSGSREKIREIEQQSSQLLIQAADEAQARDALFAATKAEVIEHLNGRFSSFKNDFIVGWSDEVRKEIADEVQSWGKDGTDVSSLRTQVQMLLEESETVRRTAQEALHEARAVNLEGGSLSQGQAKLTGAEMEDKLRALQVNLEGIAAGMMEEITKLRAETEAASQEQQKSEERASRILEDVISHVHSPNFSSQVTAGFTKALEAVRQEVQELKTTSEISQLQVMEGVRIPRVERAAEAETFVKAPTPLQSAPVEAEQSDKEAMDIDVATEEAGKEAEDAFDVAVEEIGDEG